MVQEACRRPHLHQQPGRVEGTCLGPRGQAWGEGLLAQTGRNVAYPERARCHILQPPLSAL